MTVELLPYSVSHYNSLPNIDVAGENISENDINLLTQTIGKVFIKYNVQDNFGIILLHNHFPLEHDEILVNIGSVAVPWKRSSAAKQLEDVRSTAWRFVEGAIIPYEFTHKSVLLPDIIDFPEFITELAVLLKSLGLTNKLGLCSISSGETDSTMGVEFTQGRANITLPFDLEPTSRKSIEAVWQFGTSNKTVADVGSNEESLIPVVMKKCKVACKTGPNTGHQGQHKTTNK